MLLMSKLDLIHKKKREGWVLQGGNQNPLPLTACIFLFFIYNNNGNNFNEHIFKYIC